MTKAEDSTDRAKTNAKGQGGKTQAQTNGNADPSKNDAGGKGNVRQTYTIKNIFLGHTKDGRNQKDFETIYPADVLKIIRKEAVYISLWFIAACTILILNYFRTFNLIFGIGPERLSFAYFIYFIASGLLGGVVFELSCFCTVVAKGYWHKDRRMWRLLSPLVSMGTAFIIGAMAGAGLLSGENSSTNSWAIAIGFFAGYFADEAAGKMKEIALVFFGKTSAEEQRVEEIISNADQNKDDGQDNGDQDNGEQDDDEQDDGEQVNDRQVNDSNP